MQIDQYFVAKTPFFKRKIPLIELINGAILASCVRRKDGNLIVGVVAQET